VTVSSIAHHAGLVLSLLALAAAGLRAASQLAPAGLERALTAATFASGAAGLEALALALVDLGGDSIALGLAAAATWGLSLAVFPAPRVPLGVEIAAAWRATPRPAQIILGAVGGAGAAWAAWLVHVPALGYDSVNYHLPEVVIWVRDGDPGAVIPGILDSVTYLPLMAEVLLAWQVGIAHSLVPVSLLAPASMLLLAVSGWLGLRTLDVGRLASAIAVGTLCAAPMVTHYQMNGAYNDLPALSWLITAGALAAASRRNTALLAPALVAAALAAGTKTTALPLSLFVVVPALWLQRGRLRPLALPLALAGGAALVIGGFWYARDLVVHGSPFWPDLAAPWGDPTPVESPSFLDRPRATIDRFLDDYLELFGGGLLVIGAALVVPFASRDRAVWIGGAATGLSFLLWLNAPATGAAEGGSVVGTLSTVRYVLPALAAATVTLALATRTGRVAGRAALVVLAAALVINVLQTRALGYPSVPGIRVPALGALLGASTAAAAGALARWPGTIPRWAGAAAVVAALAAAVAGLSLGASGYVERHAQANENTVYPYAGMVRWLAEQPRYRGGDDPVAIAPIPNGVVVGDRLKHRMEVIPFREPCAAVRARLRDHWVLLNFLDVVRDFTAARCLEGIEPSFEGAGFRAYRPSGASPP
jgi:hypothetical protein